MSEKATRPSRTTFVSVFRSGEFSALWLGEALTITGDQLARVALSVLVYARTGSAGLTGLTYALTFLPAMFSGGLLAGLADRYPRRTVMLCCDLASAAMVGVMAIPGMPLPVVCAAVVGLTLATTLFRAARLALLSEILDGDAYVVGMAIRSITQQTAQLVGFAGGGILVAAVDPTVGLTVTALTFLGSALLVRFGTRLRPATAAAGPALSLIASTTEGIKVIWRDPLLRACALYSWLIGLYIVPEALAAPYADDLGSGAQAVGFLLAALPAGSVIGDFLYSRFLSDEARTRLVAPMVLLSGVPLLGFAAEPGLVVAIGLLMLSGMFSAYHIQVVSMFGRSAPVEGRAQAFGLASSGLLTAQGLGVLAGGIAAEWLGPARTVAAAGLTGMLAGLAVTGTWRRGLRQAAPADGR